MKKTLIALFLFFVFLTVCYFEFNILNKNLRTNNKNIIKVSYKDDSTRKLNNYVKIKINTKDHPSYIKDYINSYIIDEVVEINVSDELTKNFYKEIEKMDLKLKDFVDKFKEKDKLLNKIDVVRNITSSLNQNVLEIKVDMYITTPYTEPIYLDYKVIIDVLKNKIIDESNEIMLTKEQIEKFNNYLFENIKKYFQNNTMMLNNKKISIDEYINNKDTIINNLVINIDNMSYYIDSNIIYTEYTDLDILKYMNMSIYKKITELTKINIYKFE